MEITPTAVSRQDSRVVHDLAARTKKTCSADIRANAGKMAIQLYKYTYIYITFYIMLNTILYVTLHVILHIKLKIFCYIKRYFKYVTYYIYI